MSEFNANNNIKSLYDEGIRGPVKPRKHGSLGRRLSKYLIPLTVWTGLGLSPPEAKAQDGYVAGVTWCQPSPPSQPFHYKIFAIEVDTNGNPLGYKWVANVPSSVQMINITGLRAGGLYEIRAQTCQDETNGSETCSVDSANKPLLVARLYGNSDVSSLPGTINRVDSYDVALCVSVARGVNKKTEDITRCDFNGDGVVDFRDLNVFSLPFGSYGKVQANPLGTNYLDCTTPFEGGSRCPETGSCGEIPYGRAESTTLAAIANPESLLRRQPDGSFILARGRSSSLHRRSESNTWQTHPWEGQGRRDAYERKPDKPARVFNYSFRNNYHR